ncbi:MAG: 3'-5' exonuclease domain-containing protein 2 [Muribaculaceae bacterium]|nr:3'-5' exonuclease domain-containing protein 2 [Muribaculaceae bacterium]
MNPENFDKAIITISKDELATLPAETFQGEIIVIDSPEKVASAVEDLLTADVIGFDTETRPSFKRGQSFNVALIQLCTPRRCYLFRTNLIGYPEELMKVFEDPNILKVGLSIRDDFHNLRKVNDIVPQGFIDLQNFVKDYKIADNSLSRLYAILFGKRVSKSQRLSNWEIPVLTEAQKSYAALDAYACISIYKYLKEGNFDASKSPYLTLPPDPEPIENKTEQ